MKKYIVTGAGGHLGSTLLRCLKDKDVEVFALLLFQETAVIEAENIRYFYGDVCQPETLEPLFSTQSSDEVIVIHAAGIISISKHIQPALYEVNVNGTRNIIRASLKHNVDRFVYVSSVHAIPELSDKQKIVEVNQFSPGLVVGGYAKTKAEATQAVLNAVTEGLPAVVVHPSGIIGPYDNGHNHLVQLVYDYLDGKLPVCVKGGYDFVDVRDVANGCLLAAEKGKVGQCYILSGNYSSIYDLLASAGKYYGKKPARAISLSLASLAVPIIELAAKLRKKRPLYTAYSLHTLKSNSHFSKKRAEQELGYRTRAFQQTLKDTVFWRNAISEI